MRETKFRAWDESERKYFGPFFLGSHLAGEGFQIDWIAEQFTGLKDKNGVEIYKGDVCQFDNKDRFFVNCEDWVEFFADWIGEPDCEDQTRDFYRIEKSEIIGNIHENPELLK